MSDNKTQYLVIIRALFTKLNNRYSRLLSLIFILTVFLEISYSARFYFTIIVLVLFAVAAEFLAGKIRNLIGTKLIKSEYKRLSIVGLMIRKELDWCNEVITFSYLAKVLGVLTNHSLPYSPFSLAYFYVFTCFIVFTLLKFGLMYYRIKKGWFGSNDWEARAIVKFIEENSDDIDFDNKNGRKKLFADSDLEQFHKKTDTLVGLPKAPRVNHG